MSTQATLPPETPAEAKSGGGVVLQRLVRHLVTLSGGICSWACGKRVAERHGTSEMALLFADTYIEDDDLYRFLVEGVANIWGYKVADGVLPLEIPPIEDMEARKAYLDKLVIPGLVRIADGRTPWEVMRDHHSFANNRMDFCSEELKRDLLDKWRDDHCSPDTVTVHVGLSWDEEHRVKRVQQVCAPWRYDAPMAEKPWLSKDMMFGLLKEQGIKPPRLYGMGFPHNNCGGFCVKAGQGHFANLLKKMPKLYRWHEEQERELRKTVGDFGLLRDRRGGTTKTLTLETLRKRIESQQEFDAYDWGGCGCAIATEAKMPNCS